MAPHSRFPTRPSGDRLDADLLAQVEALAARARARPLPSVEDGGVILDALATLANHAARSVPFQPAMARVLRVLRRRGVPLPPGYPGAAYLTHCDLRWDWVRDRVVQAVQAYPAWDTEQLDVLVAALGREPKRIARILGIPEVPLAWALGVFRERGHIQMRIKLAGRPEVAQDAALRAELAEGTRESNTLRALIKVAPPEEASVYLNRMLRQNRARALEALEAVAPDGVVLAEDTAVTLLEQRRAEDRERALLGLRKVARVEAQEPEVVIVRRRGRGPRS